MQQPGHAARVRLHFLAAAWGFMPSQSHPWLQEPGQRTDCTSREITLEQCSHPRISTGVHSLTLEPMRGPCVLKRSGSPAQVSVSPRCLTRNGAKDGKEGPGLQPHPHSHHPIPTTLSTPPSPGNICESSGHFLLASHTTPVWMTVQPSSKSPPCQLLNPS